MVSANNIVAETAACSGGEKLASRPQPPYTVPAPGGERPSTHPSVATRDFRPLKSPCASARFRRLARRSPRNIPCAESRRFSPPARCSCCSLLLRSDGAAKGGTLNRPLKCVSHRKLTKG